MTRPRTPGECHTPAPASQPAPRGWAVGFSLFWCEARDRDNHRVPADGVGKWRRPGRHRWWRSGPWPWYIAAAFIAGVVLVAVLVATLVVGRAAVHFGITPSVKASLWKPNAGNYCVGLGELSTPLGQNALIITMVANAAPTAASRSASIAYYHDFTHDLTPPTGADVARIVASYQCPPSK